MMKIAIMAMALLVGGIAFGQEKAAKTPEQKAYSLTTKLTKRLDLTEGQVAQISEVNTGIAMKNDGIRTNTSFTQEQKKEIIASNYEAAKSMYKSILTGEQYTKFIALEKERMDKKGGAKSTEEELDDL